MDENKNLNIEDPGEDNEVFFAQKKEAAKPPKVQPAYLQRRAEGVPRPEAGAETVVRRPVRGPQSTPQSSGSQRPVQRSVSQRPVQGQDQSQRPAAHRPASPAGSGAAPERPIAASRPAVQRPSNAPQPRTVQRPSAKEASAPVKEAPSYKQRRAATGGEGIPAVRETIVSPVETEPKAKTPAKPKTYGAKKPEKNKKNDKQKNAKAGADMMVSIVKAIAYMVVILVVSVFISIFVIRVGNDVFAFVKSDEAVDVTIPEDADVGDIADILSDNGIISFPGIFKMYASLKDDKGPFVAGDYTVSPSMSYDELRRSFKEQVVTGTVWITIPEGYTTDEIIDLMVENGIGERDKYIDVINNYDFDYWFIDELEKSQLKDGRVYRLEGYLFPDTYEFYKASSEETVIGRLLARFDEVFVEDYRTKAEELGYTVDEILTIASLIEKEAGGAGDFMYVSSVFHNRLNNSTYYPRLESDATTVYAIQVATGKRPDTVTPEDNKFEHPYNTYLNSGLTPGPITNPSASAIRYALYPANTSYYYFITDNAGKVYYASGIGEHEQNIAMVRKINEQLAG